MKLRKVITALLVLAISTNAHAGVFTIDLANFAGILEQINNAQKQIQRMSELVGSAREQLATLQKVSSGIRDLKNVVNGGVQGLFGSAADHLGLKDVFMVGKGVQNLVTDGMNLYKDAKSLPEDAKRQLKDIGLAVEDVQEYLANGVVYDAFSGMGINEWREVFKDPIDAFANGAVGRAVVRTEAYLDTSDLRKKYAEKLSEMTPEQRAKLTGSAGVDMAILNSLDWAKQMDKRITRSLNYSVVADKLIDSAGKQETLGGAMAVNNAAAASAIKQQAEAARDQAQSEDKTAQQLLLQTRYMRDKENREEIDDRMERVLGTP